MLSRHIALIEVKVITYQSLISLMNIQPVQHLEEVPFGNYALKLDLHHAVYANAESTGHLRCYVVYVGGDYAGYMTVMSCEMMHHKGQMQAVTDSFYIDPAYRSTGAFKALLTYVEQDVKKNNIRFFTVGLNPNMPNAHLVTGFMFKQGYNHTETSVTKEL